LFILSAEILSNKIRQGFDVKGIKVFENEIKHPSLRMILPSLTPTLFVGKGTGNSKRVWEIRWLILKCEENQGNLVGKMGK